jgi:hypothetical protein
LSPAVRYDTSACTMMASESLYGANLVDMFLLRPRAPGVCALSRANDRYSIELNRTWLENHPILLTITHVAGHRWSALELHGAASGTGAPWIQ